MITLTRLGPGRWQLLARQILPLPPGQAFTFFEAPRNLSAITPPWLRFRMVDPRCSSVWEGAEFDYTIQWLFLCLPWRTRILRYRPPVEFVDYQLRGPFALWVHHHDFREEDGATVMTDRVDMVIPTLARPFWPLIRWQLLGIFRYRARRIEEWIRREGEKKKG